MQIMFSRLIFGGANAFNMGCIFATEIDEHEEARFGLFGFILCAYSCIYIERAMLNLYSHSIAVRPKTRQWIKRRYCLFDAYAFRGWRIYWLPMVEK